MKHFLILTAAALLWAACGSSNETQAGHFIMKKAVRRLSIRSPLHGTAITTMSRGECPWRWSCRRRPSARLTWVGA